MTTSITEWITGEEFAAERRRLFDAGFGPESHEYRALQRRVRERDDHLIETFGWPLLSRLSGKWLAISLHGEVIDADREVDALVQGRQRFGAANYCVVRLTEDRGAHRIGLRRD